MRGLRCAQNSVRRPTAVQRRTFVPPQIAITGLPFQEGLGSIRSFVAWEKRVQPRSKEAEEKFGVVGSRANLSKCSDPGIDGVGRVVLNTYEGGSLVGRNDRAGVENQQLLEEYPNTEEKYRTKHLLPAAKDEHERRVKHYALLAVPRAGLVVLLKSVGVGVILQFGPRMDMCAGATTELNVDWLEEGHATVAMWRGKPTFVYHRSQKEIDKAASVPLSALRDPETDEERHANPKYAVMVAICTHLGCIPVFGEGNYGAFLCPCHGAHFDSSGRAREGPAPRNLDVPQYYWEDETTLVLCNYYDAPRSRSCRSRCTRRAP
eukprot:TRINITY_DN1348_c0_g1_i2.p1 TRINITY_DN1348_c0_g1~~TRINITY_DN1348_c0_g1_i2.p1  ORF type:complete len:320 (+),score=44.64 TRINITY_DN1348_c0_g1_i2:57-1016(+)